MQDEFQRQASAAAPAAPLLKIIGPRGLFTTRGQAMYYFQIMAEGVIDGERFDLFVDLVRTIVNPDMTRPENGGISSGFGGLKRAKGRAPMVEQINRLELRRGLTRDGVDAAFAEYGAVVSRQDFMTSSYRAMGYKSEEGFVREPKPEPLV